MLTGPRSSLSFHSNAHHHGSLPQQLGVVWDLLLKADPEGPSPIFHAALRHRFHTHTGTPLRVSLQHTLVNKGALPGRPPAARSSRTARFDGICTGRRRTFLMPRPLRELGIMSRGSARSLCTSCISSRASWLTRAPVTAASSVNNPNSAPTFRYALSTILRTVVSARITFRGSTASGLLLKPFSQARWITNRSS